MGAQDRHPFREIDAKLGLGVLNRNYFGTQFGGSMFAMTDPFFALMMGIQDAGGETVAEATKTLYIRRRAPAARKP